ncbi:MAG: hypothetical protein FWF79_05235 [Defluviitaleaceae bacterium]|nr:hypothetical protein [Defluviitaleaceae bacterium]
MVKGGKELFIILFFVAVLGGVVYFLVYFRPARDRIENMENRIATREAQITSDENAARARNAQYEIVSTEHVRLREQWEFEAADLPYVFSDTQVLRHIQDVIYPHTRAVQLGFDVSVERPGDELWSTIISLDFETSYWQFLSILYNIVQGYLGNRVVSYSFSVEPLSPADFRYMVEPVVDDMPEHIVEQFRSDFQQFFIFGNQNIEMMGMYMLSVSMEVEYLTLNPGILPPAAMQLIWDAEDAPPEDAPAEAVAYVG